MDEQEKQKLREQATQRLREKSEEAAEDASDEVREVLEDLHLHQAELEIQNEELRKSRNALEVLQRKYFDLFENAPVGYAILDHQGMILEANLTLAEMLGVERRFLTKQGFLQLVAERDRARFMEQIDLIEKSGLRHTTELLLVRAKGSPMQVLAEGSAMEEALDRQIFRLTITDIGDRVRSEKLSAEVAARRKSEEALARQNEVMKNIFAHIPVIICFHDVEGNLEFVNRAFEKILGWTLEETRRVDVMAEFYPDPVYRQGAEKHIMGLGNSEWRDFVVLCRERKERTISWAGVGLKDGTHIVIGVDITKRVMAEQALRDSEQALRELSVRLLQTQEEERRSVAMDLHDSIAAALSAIKLRLESVIGRVETEDPEALQERLSKVVGMAKRLDGSVRRLMTELRPPSLDHLGLLAALRSYCGHVQEFAPEITLVFEGEVGEEQTIPEHLKIVVFRIAQEALNNAVKHSGGDRVWLSVDQRDHRLELQVRDNGRGFDLSAMEAIHQDEKGFGLTSMRERVRLSGGELSIESTPKKGTSVHAAWSFESLRDTGEKTYY